MKKILIAAAVVGAFAGSAQAQSNVTLYGLVDLGVRFDRTSFGTLQQLQSGDLSGSRWGMMGTEDLGGGLKANFMLESAMTADNAGSTGFTRSSWLGLTGGFGEFRMGLDYTPYFNAWSSTDIFGAASLAGPGFRGAVATATSTTPGSAALNQWVGGSTRQSNSLFYKTPTMGGFRGEISYRFGEGGGAAVAPTALTKNDNNLWSYAGIYAAGPINAQVSQIKVRTNSTNTTATDTTAGARYNFGPATVSMTYWQRKTSPTTINDNTYSLGVAVPVNAWTFKGQIGKFNDKTAANADATMVGLGAEYSLSKRTDWYARFGRNSNSTGATWAISGGLMATGNVVAGSSPSAWSTGLRHKF